MTRYTVEWDSEIEADLIRFWMEGDSTQRAFYTRIADWIDRELSTDPHLKGEPRPPSERLLTTALFLPQHVSVVYRVFPADRIVRVLLLLATKEP